MKPLAKITYASVFCLAAFLTACNKDSTPTEKESEAAPVTEVAEVATETVVTETTAEDTSKPFMAASQETTIVATVSALNQETREVTLKDDEGNEHSFIASEEVRNLPQVSVGDLVTITYLQNITIEVVEGEGLQAAEGAVADAVRAEEGAMPGMAASETKVAIYKVEDINIEANTFKLSDVNGTVQEYHARNPENLKRSKVGDAVIVTTTQAVAAEVTKMPTE